MNVQYISDHKGKHTGVYIPINEWKKLTKRYDLPVDEGAVDRRRKRSTRRGQAIQAG